MRRSPFGMVSRRCSTIVFARRPHKPLSPTWSQGLEDGLPQDIRMVAVTEMEGSRFPERFVDHESGGFVKRLRTEIGIIGGCERLGAVSQLRKGGQKRGGTQDDDLAVFC